MSDAIALFASSRRNGNTGRLVDRIATELGIEVVDLSTKCPDLVNDGRRLRGKTAYVACTSIYEEAPSSLVASFRDTFEYLGMRFGGIAHANCRDGYVPDTHDVEAQRFARLVSGSATRVAIA